MYLYSYLYWSCQEAIRRRQLCTKLLTRVPGRFSPLSVLLSIQLSHYLRILMCEAPHWALIISLIILPGKLSKEKIRLW